TSSKVRDWARCTSQRNSKRSASIRRSFVPSAASHKPCESVGLRFSTACSSCPKQRGRKRRVQHTKAIAHCLQPTVLCPTRGLQRESAQLLQFLGRRNVHVVPPALLVVTTTSPRCACAIWLTM